MTDLYLTLRGAASPFVFSGAYSSSGGGEVLGRSDVNLRDRKKVLPSSLFLFSPLDRGIPRIPLMEYDPAGSLEALVTGGEAWLVLPIVWPGVRDDPSGDGWKGCWTFVRMILGNKEEQMSPLLS
ncbi:hypothetical protein CgunFtcFv8_001979 [Champsocephalus gunnari]|uniref:Uncharacterized protein n=1 Tax=Champsocephalus gunnari TaxID=52237 RepID=A0AAN8HB01_CHAGU|nr:hypothetical protein CgunFtcFv8_001979 [Champsocephalus gunnari]